MISNKLVTIVKDNQFDKGWTIFSPTSFEIERNMTFKKVDLANVVKLITFSTEVDLILSELCLPLRIINELAWSNKYIKINLIAKSKEIAERYNRLTFNSCKIDEKTNINYIGIKGKDSGFYLLDDDLCEIDDSIESIYFGNAKKTDNYSCLEKAKTLIICNHNKHQDFNNIVTLAKKYKIACQYIISSKYFDRDAYDFAKQNEVELFVSDYVDDAILVINKDNSIYKMSVMSDGFPVLFPIARISSFVGDIYKSLFLDDTISVNKIPKDVYSCLNGKNEKLDIRDAVVIRKDVEINEMSDFINEVFDKSITDKHNDYSNKGRTTQYFFTLIPPLFDSSYNESTIYNPIHKLHSDWTEINSVKFDRVIRDYHHFMSKDAKLLSFIKYANDFSCKLEQAVNKCYYVGYYSLLNDAIEKYDDYQNTLLSDCLFMFNEINSESSGSKYDKFDVEIEGYRKTIKEKETLIFMGTDVLSNKRRIEILNKKIEDLLALKEKFESSAASRSNKEADSFIAYCKDLIGGKSDSNSNVDDSIGKIVNINEESKKVQLNSFVINYLKQINDYLTKSLVCLRSLVEIQIPEEYPVFEKGNQRYIVLNELDEYQATILLCKEFSLKCLARR